MRALVILLMAATLAVSAEPQKKAASKPANKGIPAGAEQIRPGVYRHVDAYGKVWIYRRSPFGWAKSSEKDLRAADSPKESGSEGELSARAVEEGDSIRFTRRTPFGTHTWSRKKTELTEEEQKIWDRQKPAVKEKDEQVRN